MEPGELDVAVERLIDERLADPAAERVRQSHASALRELQRTRVVKDVRIADNNFVLIHHRLGRKAEFVTHSPPRGAITAGIISEARGNDPSGRPMDATQVVCLVANGYGAAVTVDVEVR